MAQKSIGGRVELVNCEPFTVVSNALILDKRLKLQTRAVLIIMLSRPPDWDYSVRGIATIAGVSADAIARAFRELETAGYLRREQIREGGRFLGVAYKIASHPIFEVEDPPCPENPYTVKPCTDLPCTENPAQLNTEYTKDLNTIPPIVPQEGDGPCADNTPEPAPQPEPEPVPQPAPKPKPKRRHRADYKEAPDWMPERFAAFWDSYPGGGSKQAAIRAWDALQPDDRLLHEMALGLQRQLGSELWQRGIGIPNASTWLNGRRWTDKLRAEPHPPEEPGSGGQSLRGEGVRYL